MICGSMDYNRVDWEFFNFAAHNTTKDQDLKILIDHVDLLTDRIKQLEEEIEALKKGSE